MLFINEAAFVPHLLFDKRVFAREHGAHAYSALAWHSTWLLKMLLTSAIKTVFYTPCFYFLAGLRLEWFSYIGTAFVAGAMGFGGSATAMLIATAIPSLGSAMTGFMSSVIVWMNLCTQFPDPIRY